MFEHQSQFTADPPPTQHPEGTQTDLPPSASLGTLLWCVNV